MWLPSSDRAPTQGSADGAVQLSRDGAVRFAGRCRSAGLQACGAGAFGEGLAAIGPPGSVEAVFVIEAVSMEVAVEIPAVVDRQSRGLGGAYLVDEDAIVLRIETGEAEGN